MAPRRCSSFGSPAALRGFTLSLLGALSAWAPASAEGFLGLQRYTLREGLPQMTVTRLIEAPDGHLWVGTQEGLSRFDGQVFDVFRHQPGEQASLSSSSVDALAIDPEGRLWIGTNDQGVEIRGLQDTTLQRIGPHQGLSHPTVNGLLVLADGVIAGTPRGFDRLRIDPPGAAPLQSGVEAVGLAAIGTRAYGLGRGCRLWQLDPGPARALPAPFPEGAECVGLQADAESLWALSASHGLARLDAEGRAIRHWVPARLGTEDGRPSALGLLRSGALVVGFDSGAVARLESGHADAAIPLQLSMAAGSRITAFLEQSSGTLWIGTYSSGLLRAGTLSSALHAGLDSPGESRNWPSRSVYSVWHSEALGLLGTDRGLLRREVGGGPWTPVPSIGRRSVRRILPHPEGGWWIGTLDGLWRLLPDGRAERHATGIDARISDLIYEGTRLWISTRNGLYWSEPGQAPTQIGVPEALRRGFLTALLLDPQGNLWIGSNESGLRVLTADGGMRWMHRGNGQLVVDSVWALHAAPDGVYVGTYGGGLQRMRLDDATPWHLGTRDGMSNNVVYRIETDGRGRLWLSTNRGLNLVETETRRIQVISASDGLANTEYNAGASFKDARGRLYFGGTEGLDVLDPDAVPDTAAAAVPRLARLEVVGGRSRLHGADDPDWQAIAIKPPLKFDWDQRVLSATLVAIDLSAPDAARLRYRVRGLDDRWIIPRTPRSELLLSGLSAGAYQLELEAAGRDGRFGQTEVIDVSIAPPPWASPWAYASYALLALGALGWLAWSLRRRSRAKQIRIIELNALVEQRTADLQRANRQLRQSNAQLDRAGRTDPLTQVSNRRDLQEWLDQRTGQGDAPDLMFCLLDIDDFKSINDRRGHRIGDQALVAFAGRLRELCREHDLVVRWGGEEFLLVLQGMRDEDVDALLDRVQQRVTSPIEVEDGEALHLHCSIGAAAWPFVQGIEGFGWEQSVALADRALYRAKAEGKRRWQRWSAGPTLTRSELLVLLSGAPIRDLPADVIRIHRSSETASGDGE